jgi:hypothetical protein
VTRGWHEDRDDRAVRDGERACEDFYGDDRLLDRLCALAWLAVIALWAVIIWAIAQAATA